MKNQILESIEEAVRAMELLREPTALLFIERAAQEISACFRRGGKLLIAGNGGSLCDAMHFAEELTGLYRKPRRALAAIALADPGHLSCTANDLGYEKVFARSIDALGKKEDIFVVLTTSGNSPNIINAVDTAKGLGLKVMGFLGRGGGKLKGHCDWEWIVDGFSYSDRIQEAHMTAIHIIIELIEKELF
jgi:D-sedoheptulose 7-phosphate isomerase